MRVSVLIAIILFSFGCGFDSKSSSIFVTQDDIEKSFAIDRLLNETYYFPAKKQGSREVIYQPLERFDLIFAGHDLNSSSSFLAYATPGLYTHILAYLGKDSQGFAYAVEINGNDNENFTIVNGLKVDGRLFVYCLGSDYGDRECPKDQYIHGIETYNYVWAKRLKYDLREQLIQHNDILMTTIKEDLMTAYPVQLPFHVGLETFMTKEITLVDDGRKNGADCTAYFVSLFEEVAGVCLDEVRMDADSFKSYYLYDPIGKEAKIPAEYNFFSSGELYISELFTDLGYSLVDNTPRQTLCHDARIVTGVPTPNLIFNSPSMVEINLF